MSFTPDPSHSLSASTTPIPPHRFAAALEDLGPSTLHLKVLELRNSLAHLRYSNEQLAPFATADPPDQDCADAIRENDEVMQRMAVRVRLVRRDVERRGMAWTEFSAGEEQEVWEAGLVRAALQAGTAEAERLQHLLNQEPGTIADKTATNGVHEADSAPEPEVHPAWMDGTFQTGTIRNGTLQMDTPDQTATLASSATRDASAAPTAQMSVAESQSARQQGASGGRLADDELRRAMELRLREMDVSDEEEEEGMHL